MLVVEQFFPKGPENEETDELVVKEMGMVAAKFWRKEFQDDKKATYDDNFSATN